jgi:hypothetical protein
MYRYDPNGTAYSDGRRDGAAAERAKIVALLNEQARLACIEGHLESMTALVQARLAIERG